VKLLGGGFEFDNIAVSDLPQVPADGEVSVQFIPGANEPPAESEEPLASTGMGETNLIGLGLTVAGLAVAAVAVRRKRARV
jgi:LPXTG-motif cell wall-anchored protein